MAEDASGRDKGTSFLRVFRILEVVIDANRPLTAAEISEGVGLPRPTTHRLCKMLLSERLLQYEIDGKRMLEAHVCLSLPGESFPDRTWISNGGRF